MPPKSNVASATSSPSHYPQVVRQHQSPALIGRNPSLAAELKSEEKERRRLSSARSSPLLGAAAVKRGREDDEVDNAVLTSADGFRLDTLPSSVTEGAAPTSLHSGASSELTSEVSHRPFLSDLDMPSLSIKQSALASSEATSSGYNPKKDNTYNSASATTFKAYADTPAAAPTFSTDAQRPQQPNYVTATEAVTVLRARTIPTIVLAAMPTRPMKVAEECDDLYERIVAATVKKAVAHIAQQHQANGGGLPTAVAEEDDNAVISDRARQEALAQAAKQRLKDLAAKRKAEKIKSKIMRDKMAMSTNSRLGGVVFKPKQRSGSSSSSSSSSSAVSSDNDAEEGAESDTPNEAADATSSTKDFFGFSKSTGRLSAVVPTSLTSPAAAAHVALIRDLIAAACALTSGIPTSVTMPNIPSSTAPSSKKDGPHSTSNTGSAPITTTTTIHLVPSLRVYAPISVFSNVGKDTSPSPNALIIPKWLSITNRQQIRNVVVVYVKGISYDDLEGSDKGKLMAGEGINAKSEETATDHREPYHPELCRQLLLPFRSNCCSAAQPPATGGFGASATPVSIVPLWVENESDALESEVLFMSMRTQINTPNVVNANETPAASPTAGESLPQDTNTPVVPAPPAAVPPAKTASKSAFITPGPPSKLGGGAGFMKARQMMKDKEREEEAAAASAASAETPAPSAIGEPVIGSKRVRSPSAEQRDCHVPLPPAAAKATSTPTAHPTPEHHQSLEVYEALRKWLQAEVQKASPTKSVHILQNFFFDRRKAEAKHKSEEQRDSEHSAHEEHATDKADHRQPPKGITIKKTEGATTTISIQKDEHVTSGMGPMNGSTSAADDGPFDAAKRLKKLLEEAVAEVEGLGRPPVPDDWNPNADKFHVWELALRIIFGSRCLGPLSINFFYNAGEPLTDTDDVQEPAGTTPSVLFLQNMKQPNLMLAGILPPLQLHKQPEGVDNVANPLLLKYALAEWAHGYEGLLDALGWITSAVLAESDARAEADRKLAGTDESTAAAAAAEVHEEGLEMRGGWRHLSMPTSLIVKNEEGITTATQLYPCPTAKSASKPNTTLAPNIQSIVSGKAKRAMERFNTSLSAISGVGVTRTFKRQNNKAIKMGLPSGYHNAHHYGHVFAFDCEMVQGEDRAYLLARATIVHVPTAIILCDVLVAPREPILDYVTRYSGITEEMLAIPRKRKVFVPAIKKQSTTATTNTAGGVTQPSTDNDTATNNQDAPNDDDLESILSDVTSEDSLCEHDYIIEGDYTLGGAQDRTVGDDNSLLPIWRLEDVQDLFQLMLDDCHQRKVHIRSLQAAAMSASGGAKKDKNEREFVSPSIDEHVYIIGHSLENDFKACRIPLGMGNEQLSALRSDACRKTIIDGLSRPKASSAMLAVTQLRILDTSHLFPHKGGMRFKNALRFLTQNVLRKRIQQGTNGHDSIEDATVCAELVLLRWLKMQMPFIPTIASTSGSDTQNTIPPTGAASIPQIPAPSTCSSSSQCLTTLCIRRLLQVENPFRFLLDGGASLMAVPLRAIKAASGGGLMKKAPSSSLTFTNDPSRSAFVAFNTHMLPSDTTPAEREAGSTVSEIIRLAGGINGLGGGSGAMVVTGGGNLSNKVHLQRALPLGPDPTMITNHKNSALEQLKHLLQLAYSVGLEGVGHYDPEASSNSYGSSSHLKQGNNNNNPITSITLKPLTRFCMVDCERVLKVVGGCGRTIIRDDVASVALRLTTDLSAANIAQLLSAMLPNALTKGISRGIAAPTNLVMDVSSAADHSNLPFTEAVAVTLRQELQARAARPISASSEKVAALVGLQPNNNHHNPHANNSGATPRIVSDTVLWYRTPVDLAEVERNQSAMAKTEIKASRADKQPSTGNDNKIKGLEGLVGDASVVANTVSILRNQFEAEEAYFTKAHQWEVEANEALKVHKQQQPKFSEVLPPLVCPPPVAPQPLFLWAQLQAAAGEGVGGKGAPFRLTAKTLGQDSVTESSEEYLRRNQAAIEQTINQPLLAIVDALPPCSVLLVVAADCRPNNGNRLSKAHGALVAMVKGGDADSYKRDRARQEGTMPMTRPKKGTSAAYRSSVGHLTCPLPSGSAATSGAPKHQCDAQ